MKNEYRELIAEFLIGQRTARGLTQKKIAEMISIPVGTYQKYEEKRATPSIITLIKFCRVTQSSILDLIQKIQDITIEEQVIPEQ